MTKAKSLVSRRRLIGASLMIPLLALAIWHFNTRSTSAQGKAAGQGKAEGGPSLGPPIFSVSPKAGKTFLPSTTTPGTTFQIEGDITLVNERGQSLPGDDGSTGQFYRSGVVLDSGFSLVNDVYVLRTSNAVFTATGILKGAVVSDLENADLLVVTGGIGIFRGANGEAQLITTDATTGKFTVRVLGGGD